jgi:DUF4097 and DUF4098 domain-containing protein YvlB
LLTTLAAGALAALSLVQTDTVISVRPGARLDVENFGGDIVVRVWDRDAVHIQADHSERETIEITTSEGVVHVESSTHRGPPAMVDYQISVPASLNLSLSGVYADVTVEGTRGPVSVETVQGEIRVRGGSGHVSLSSVQGGVDLEGASGQVEVHSVNETVRVAATKGDLYAETINGDVILERIESSNVEASTVNGQVIYEGTIQDAGRYRFATHNGDVAVAVQPGANATVSVETFSGEFEATFPVTVRETKKDKRFTFTLGSGSAQVELESFQGLLRVVRPAEAAAEVRRLLSEETAEEHHEEEEEP